MTESEFKHNYVQSYLAAYGSAVAWFPDSNTVTTADQLLNTAKQNADRAWQNYLRENPSEQD